MPQNAVKFRNYRRTIMKKLLAFILVLVMLTSIVTCFPMSVAAVTPTLLTGAEEPTKDTDGAYLISEPKHLLWMAQQHKPTMASGTTYGGTNQLAEGCSDNPLQGKVFKQMNDIDLGGCVLPSIGCANVPSEEFPNLHAKGKYSVFGGTYDGQGYAIKNGYVINQDPSENEFKPTSLGCAYYGTGLFGVISGATIKNVNLKNIDIYTDEETQISAVGLLVGIAAAPVTTEANADAVNNIINCTTDVGCNIIASNVGGGGATAARAQRWGGLVGTAYRTNITNCTNNANITVNRVANYAGGIVGQFLGGTVKDCINYGNITITEAATSKTVFNWRSWGGIVGVVPYNNTYEYDNTTVDNCLNKGNIKYDGTPVISFVSGGIVGGARKPRKVTITISNCANLGDIALNKEATIGYAEGAIMGGVQIYSSDITTYPINIVLENNTSVEMSLNNSNAASVAGNGTGTVVKSVNIGDSTVAFNLMNLNSSSADSVGEKSVTFTDCKIDNDIPKIDMLYACDIVLQKGTGENAGKYRFLASINGAEWNGAGFKLKVSNGEEPKQKEIPVTVAYESYTVDVASAEKPQVVTDASGRMYICLVVTGVTEGWTVEASAYVNDGTKSYYSADYSFTFK